MAEPAVLAGGGGGRSNQTRRKNSSQRKYRIHKVLWPSCFKTLNFVFYLSPSQRQDRPMIVQRFEVVVHLLLAS